MATSIKIKRAQTEQGPPTKAEELEKLHEVADAQIESSRYLVEQTIKRMGKGAAKWEEQGWAWEEPDWTAPVGDWPPLARLLELVVDLLGDISTLAALSHLRRPRYCGECDPDHSEKGWQQARCREHLSNAEQVEALATHLGWRE